MNLYSYETKLPNLKLLSDSFREVDDATAVMAIVMLLFIIPAKPKKLLSSHAEGG